MFTAASNRLPASSRMPWLLTPAAMLLSSVALAAAPPAPTNLTASSPTVTAVQLDWTPSSGASTYQVYKSFTPGGETTPYKTGITAPPYKVGGLLANTTYYFTVAAVAAGGVSAQSNEVKMATTPPNFPGNFAATAAGPDSIQLTWTAPSGAQTYNLYKGTSAGGESATPAVTGITGTSYTVTGLTASTAYYFTLTALANGGESPKSKEATATTSAVAAPGGVSTSAPTSTSVKLSWTLVPGAQSYNVYKGTSAGGESATPYATGITTAPYNVTGLSPNTNYYFKVSAKANGVEGAKSAEVGATTSLPPAPTGLNVSPNGPNMSLFWSSVAGAQSYNVYRGTGPGGESATPVTSVMTNYLTDTGLIGNTTYYYKVAAVANGGIGSQSTEVSAATYPPSNTTNVSATAGSPTTVQLSWTASTGADSYDILVGTSPGGESSTPYASTSASSYLVTGLRPNTAYYFIVRSMANGRIGGPSSEVSATTLPPPSPPSGITATPYGTTKIKLTWSAVSGATGYNIYLGTSSGGESATPVASNVAGTSYTVPSLSSGTTYYLKMASVTSGTAGGLSAEVSATTATPGETVLYNFGTGTNAPLAPDGSLLEGSDGNFYGTTYMGGGPCNSGGASGCGTVYKLTHSGILTVLHSFSGTTADGQYPWATLIQDSAGNLYGTTSGGGAYGSTGNSSGGVVFSLSPTNSETILHSFGSSSVDGQVVKGKLLFGSDGLLYGTTQYGGQNGKGTSFYITPAGAEFGTHSFGTGGVNNTDGYSPNGLIQGADGYLYGTASMGGSYYSSSNGGGTFFRIDSGTLYPLWQFGGTAQDGQTPGSVIQATDGTFYGVTWAGGSYGKGTIFKFYGGESVLYAFGGNATDGQNPTSLIQGSDGNLYGTTDSGGQYGKGTVFRVTPAGVETVLYSFGTNPNDGTNPVGVIQGKDGNLYGTCGWGGAYNFGNVFRIAIGL